MHAAKRYRQHGFTLIEMLTVIVILGIVSAIGAKVLGVGFDAYFKGKGYMVADSQTRIALARMTRELRTIRTATAGDLTMLPATAITFRDTGGVSIKYSLTGTSLMRNTQVLADGVTGLSFSYLQRDGKTVAATVTTVYYVVVGYTVVYGSTNRVVRTVIHPRNIF